MSDPVTLASGQWRLWTQFALRGPGFPAAGVAGLARPGLAEAADKAAESSAVGPDWAQFEEEFAEAAVAVSRRLQEVAALPAFQAAVAWQNPALLRTGIAPFLAWEPTAAGRTSMPRQREELVAHYWQRFCVKNDTIGFFGPVGWGAIDPDVPGVEVEPGTGLVAASAVYFSSWAVDAVAKAVSADPTLRRWVPPRRMAFVRVAADGVRVPGRPDQRATALELTVLALCDGVRLIEDIAAACSATPAEVEATVAAMAARRWLVWRLEVPADAHPEQHLRAALARVADAAVRTRATAALDRLEAARDRVRAAGTDATALTAAFTALEQDFADLTGTAAQREKAARTAPCRALVYSDSRRSATARVGAAVLAELGPLELCLTAARWMTNRFAEAMRPHLRAAYDRLAVRGPVDLSSLWFACLPVPHPAAAVEIDRIVAELRARWADIIGPVSGVRHVRLSSADIAQKVRAAFAEQASGWWLARFISPDVVIAASSADAVADGEFELVLGELHVAMNTIGASLFVHQHPDPAALLAETTADFPGPRIMPMLPKEQPPRWSARSKPTLVRPEDYYVGMVDYTTDPHRSRTVMGADAVVVPREDWLAVVLPDGAEFDLLDVFGNAMTNQVMDRFTLRQDGDHSPRITVDRMVLARESWRFRGADLDFAAVKSESRRFVAARAWRAAHGLPRHVFVTSPVEPRPFYVDFDAPVYVNILGKAARRLDRADPAAKLTAVEMLPTPDQAWLTDDEGNRYTSELRFVAVDQTGGAR